VTEIFAAKIPTTREAGLVFFNSYFKPKKNREWNINCFSFLLELSHCLPNADGLSGNNPFYVVDQKVEINFFGIVLF
jgi:hypothetical protein